MRTARSSRIGGDDMAEMYCENCTDNAGCNHEHLRDGYCPFYDEAWTEEKAVDSLLGILKAMQPAEDNVWDNIANAIAFVYGLQPCHTPSADVIGRIDWLIMVCGKYGVLHGAEYIKILENVKAKLTGGKKNE